MSIINFMLSWDEHEKSRYNLGVWSHLVDVQGDLSLQWVHLSFCHELFNIISQDGSFHRAFSSNFRDKAPGQNWEKMINNIKIGRN